jgi:hypothetical protein
MSVTTVAAPIGDRPASTRASLRLALVAIALAVLLAASFVVGRVTASSTSSGTTSIVPAAPTSGGVDSCPHARYC